MQWNKNLEEEYEINQQIQEKECNEILSKKQKKYLDRINGGFQACVSLMLNEQQSK